MLVIGTEPLYLPTFAGFYALEINLFMKNNYALGGNNCSLILSTRPGSVPVTDYDEKRVAIAGIGAVSAIGHSINEILEYMAGK